jgi:hypothetical protein
VLLLTGAGNKMTIIIPTEDGIDMQDIRLLAGEGKLSQKTIRQAVEIIRKQRKENETKT